MKNMKQILASLMVVVMVLTAAPLSGFVGLELPDFGRLFSTKAEAATDPYYSKYGVTYNQLFRLYPSYLSPTGESVVLNPAVSAYTDVIESYDSYSTFVGSYLYSLKEGVSMYSTTVLSWFNLAQSYEEKFRSEAIEALMKEVCENESILAAGVEQIESEFGMLKDTYKLATTAEKTAFVSDIKKHCTMLTDSTIEQIADGMFDNSDKIISRVGDVVDYSQLIISVFALRALEETIINDVKNSLDSGSVLKEDLELLLENMNKSVFSYVFEHYLSDKFAGLYTKAINSAIAYAANSGASFGSTIAGTLVSTVFKVAVKYLYTWALGDEIAQTIYLSTYTTDLDIAVQKRRTAFLRGTAKTDDDIAKYKLLYSSYVRAIKVTLESALKMAKTSADKDRVKQAIALINSFTYDNYIDFCMTQLKRDIDAGKVKKTASMNEGDEASTATQEESRISIQEKFRQLQAAYPPNQGVTFFQSYGGAIQCFGFARFAFNKIFDCDMPAAYYNEKRYEYVNNQNVVMLGQLNGTSQMTEANVKALLSQAMVGDIIQACGGASQHTMMVVGASDSGITVYECNWGGDCCIYQRTISYASFAATYSQPHSVSASGVTLYRAANYDSLYWDGTAVFYDDSVNFVIEDGVLTKYNGWQQYVVIPEEVTSIGDQAFHNNDRIIGVTMMDNVVSIGNQSFAHCNNLYFCQLSNNLESIGIQSFYDCTNLSSATMPNTLVNLGEGAYNYCDSLSYASISNSLQTIKPNTFAYCFSLINIEIPDSVTVIENRAFNNCNSLSSVYLSRQLTEMGWSAFGKCTSLTSIEIPKSLKTTYGYEGPFAYCSNLKSVVFETGGTVIPSYLFAYCTGIEDIIVPDTVTVIEEMAFDHCTNLKSVYISDSVKTIEREAFEECTNLSYVYLSKQLTEMGYRVFGKCTSLTSIEIPKSLKTTHGYEGPFAYCSNLAEVSFEKGRTAIPGCMFAYCTGIKEIVIPDTVTVIEEYAFDSCTNLNTIVLSNELKTIERNVFSNCTSIVECVLPNSMINLSYSVFQGCTSLKSITIPDSVVSLSSSSGLFKDCYALESVKLPNKIDTLPSQLFYNCKTLVNIDLPETLVNIGNSAFKNCILIKNLDFLESTKVQVIENYSFENCTSLKDAILPETVTSVGSYAFQNCTALEKVYVPQSTKTIGSQIFKGCEMLSDVTFADYSISEIPSQAFMDCPSLTELVFPKGLKKIGSQAFVNDISLFNLTIPMSVTSIDSTAFSYPAKTTIYGVAGTYAETFADNGGFNFTDISAPCEGIILVDEVEYVILDVGETFRAVFEYWPEEHTDIVTLTASNTNVTINGMDIYARYTGDTVITATTSSGCTYEFNVHIRNPKSISITTQPDKLEYITGEELDLTGMVVQVLYNDNSTKEVSNYTVSGFDSSAEGTYTVTVKWVSAANSTYSTSFKVTVIDPAPELTGIEVTKLPDKTTYAKRESFDPTGMVISGLYSDGSTAEVTGYKVTGYNALKTGTQTLTVTYEGFTAQFTVTVGAFCTHSTTEVRDASIATCTTAGYTGDTYCTSCNALVVSGMEIPAVLQGCIASGDKLCGLTSGMSTDEFVEKYFNSDTSEIEFDSSVVATGVVVTVTHQSDVSESYEILLFGDVNGDGWYDGQDAVIVSCLANGMLTQDDVSEAVYMAADCNHDGVIDQADVALLNEAGALLSNVDQTMPAEVLLETSSEYVEYLDLIDQSPELDIEDETDAPEADAEETPEQDAKVNIFEMIMNFIKSIFEMLIAYIPVLLK